MPAILNIATNLALGALLVIIARRSRAMRQEFLNWQLLFLTAFEAAIFTPIATYLFRFYPQWSLLYLFDPQLYPEFERYVGLLSAVVVLLNFVALIGGFAAARWGLLNHRKWAMAAPMGVAALVWLIVVAVFPDRIFLLGDFDTFWQGSASLIFRHAPGWAAIVLHSSMVVFVLWVRRNFAHHDPSIL